MYYTTRIYIYSNLYIYIYIKESMISRGNENKEFLHCLRHNMNITWKTVKY